MKIEIFVGRKLFEFSSYQDWCDKAQELFKAHEVNTRTAICIDTMGRICTCGADFSNAQNAGAYPVQVFAVRPEKLW